MCNRLDGIRSPVCWELMCLLKSRFVNFLEMFVMLSIIVNLLDCDIYGKFEDFKNVLLLHENIKYILRLGFLLRNKIEMLLIKIKSVKVCK